MFYDGWTSYDLGEACVTGSERPNEDTLSLPENRVNIVLLHGQERAGKGTPQTDTIRLGKLKNKHIDYLALGHIHEYRVAKVDRRCTACYCGCLEGRGFDECGACGFVLLEINGKQISQQFIPFATRRMHSLTCDVTGISSQFELEERLRDTVREIPSKDMVKVILTGKTEPGVSKDLLHLRALLSERFYFSKIRDDSRVLIDPEEYLNDISLKGEFVRRVMASNLSEEEKNRVLACGFRVLAGEDVGL